MAIIKCPDCGKEISDQTPQCPNCGRPIATVFQQQMPPQNFQNQQSQANQKPQKERKDTTLSIWAAVLGFFTCTAYIGGILAIIDLIKNKGDGKRHIGSYFALFMCVVATIIAISNSGKSEPTVKKTGEIAQTSSSSTIQQQDASTVQQQESSSAEEHSNIFYPGEIAETKDLRITFLSTGVYVSDNQFLQPKDGYEYREFEFIFENLSESDAYVSTMMDWECYADDIKVDQFYNMDDNGLDATLSKGRKAQGKVYFEVPVDAEKVELEYDINFWLSDKIIFVGK